jgi:small subunit ribosomal protein S17
MRIIIGKVISKLDEKTAKVSVDRVVVHPLYKKRFRRSRGYLVHDEIGVEVGDKVKFSDSKPYSKTKKWKIIERIAKK